MVVVLLGGGGCVLVVVVFIVVLTVVDSVLFGAIVVDLVCTVDFIVVDGALLVVFRVVVGGFFATR
jgi:hypothetical protein